MASRDDIADKLHFRVAEGAEGVGGDSWLDALALLLIDVVEQERHGCQEHEDGQVRREAS